MNEPLSEIEIDLADLSREVLELLIKLSCERNQTVNEVISEILESFINHNP